MLLRQWDIRSSSLGAAETLQPVFACPHISLPAVVGAGCPSDPRALCRGGSPLRSGVRRAESTFSNRSPAVRRLQI